MKRIKLFCIATTLCVSCHIASADSFGQVYNPLSAINKELAEKKQERSKQKNTSLQQYSNTQQRPSSTQAPTQQNHARPSTAQQTNRGYYGNQRQRQEKSPWIQSNPWAHQVNDQRYSDPNYKEQQTTTTDKTTADRHQANLQAVYGNNQQHNHNNKKQQQKNDRQDQFHVPSSRTLSPY